MYVKPPIKELSDQEHLEFRSVPDRPRVVVLNSVARLSGAELALLRVAPVLARLVELTVVLAEDGPLVDRLRAEGIDVRLFLLDPSVGGVSRRQVGSAGLSVRKVRHLMGHVWALSRLLRTLDTDVVLCNNLKSAVYGGVAGRLARVPVLWHLRDRIAPDYLPGFVVTGVRLLSRVLPGAVIANSKATLATVPRDGAVVPDSVVLTTAVADRKPTDRPVTVGMIARLSPWKGQDVFLRAFAEAFGGTDASARLVGSALFGENEVQEQLRQLVLELGIEQQVEFRGFREDVVGELLELDIAVHASTIPEPFGLVVLEAMATGVPIIAADEGGPAEVITSGVDGLLVRPRDPSALAAALRQLAGDADLRAALAAAGRTTASAYTPERTAAGIVTACNSLLGRLPPGQAPPGRTCTTPLHEA